MPSKTRHYDPEVRPRTCLRCLLLFVSQWAGNRICDVCKGTWEFKHAAKLGEEHGTLESNGKRSKARPGE